MVQEEILRKLNNELQKDITEETQVVYILSRIRKYLDCKGAADRYKILRFYCNLALHCDIYNIKGMQKILSNFISYKDNDGFMFFEEFTGDFKKFLSENNIDSNKIFSIENYVRFQNLLVDIYSDTPIKVDLDGVKKVITIERSSRSLENINFMISINVKDDIGDK